MEHIGIMILFPLPVAASFFVTAFAYRQVNMIDKSVKTGYFQTNQPPVYLSCKKNCFLVCQSYSKLNWRMFVTNYQFIGLT